MHQDESLIKAEGEDKMTPYLCFLIAAVSCFLYKSFSYRILERPS